MAGRPIHRARELMKAQSEARKAMIRQNTEGLKLGLDPMPLPPLNTDPAFDEQTKRYLRAEHRPPPDYSMFPEGMRPGEMPNSQHGEAWFRAHDPASAEVPAGGGSAAQPKTPALSEENAKLLNEAVKLALEEHLDTLRMENNPYGNPQYIKIKQMKAKAASDIMSLQGRIDPERLKGRDRSKAQQLAEKIETWRNSGSA